MLINTLKYIYFGTDLGIGGPIPGATPGSGFILQDLSLSTRPAKEALTADSMRLIVPETQVIGALLMILIHKIWWMRKASRLDGCIVHLTAMATSTWEEIKIRATRSDVQELLKIKTRTWAEHVQLI
ncbi:hypothetical protein vseg_010616 [Gypsophila vaccaria]